MTASIYAALRERVANGVTPEAAAEAVLRKARKGDLAAFVRPLLVLEARRYTRADVRAVEVEMDERIAAGEDPMAARSKLMAESFALPDGRYVTWADATADDHLSRAGWQRGMAAASTADAVRHEAAATQITAAGVRCLRDLGVAALAVPA